MSFSVVLAGGGCRTAWSVGFFEELRPDLPAPREWAGVSAGACMAVGLAAGRTEAMMERFLALAQANRRNVYPERLLLRGPLRRGAGTEDRKLVFPHEAMYRATVASALAGDGFAALRNAAPIRILLAHLPESRAAWRPAWSAYRDYRCRKRAGVIHGSATPPPGFAVEIVTAQDLESARAVEDAILASSATPLVTRLPRRNGRVYVDGGFVENVPLRGLSPDARAGRCLVLLTRPIPPSELPSDATRLYVAPERAVPIAKWDYASPAKLEATYELGRRDGARLRERVLAWLEGDGVDLARNGDSPLSSAAITASAGSAGSD